MDIIQYFAIFFVDVAVNVHCIGHEEDALMSQDQQIVMFKMKTLVAATENFHDDNKLGEGGFGPVYKVA